MLHAKEDKRAMEPIASIALLGSLKVVGSATTARSVSIQIKQSRHPAKRALSDLTTVFKDRLYATHVRLGRTTPEAGGMGSRPTTQTDVSTAPKGTVSPKAHRETATHAQEAHTKPLQVDPAVRPALWVVRVPLSVASPNVICVPSPVLQMSPGSRNVNSVFLGNSAQRRVRQNAVTARVGITRTQEVERRARIVYREHTAPGRHFCAPTASLGGISQFKERRHALIAHSTHSKMIMEQLHAMTVTRDDILS